MQTGYNLNPKCGKDLAQGRSEGGVPEGGFAGKAELVEGGGGFGEGGFEDGVAGVAGPIRMGEAGELPGSPGTGALLGGTRAAEAGGEVLVVDAGVADEGGGAGVGHDPVEGVVGQRPIFEGGGGGGHIGEEGAVHGEEGAGGEAALPEVLAIGEGAEVKIGAAVGTVAVEFAPVEDSGGGRKMGAGSGHGRYLAGNGVGGNGEIKDSGLGRGAWAGMMGGRVAPPGAACAIRMSEAESKPPLETGLPAEGVEGVVTGEQPPGRQVQKVSLGKYLALLPLYVVARLWLATLRMRISEQERAWLSDTRTPLVTVVWHNRLFITSELRRRYRHTRRMVGLVSASGDGAWLAEYFRLVGIAAVRGSSSWRGMQAVRELLAVMKEGSDIAITPDGPRGPCYEVQPGALMVARLAKTPLLLISARIPSAWRLRSWDGFYLPKPFSVVEVRIGWLADYASLGTGDDETTRRELQRRMMEITED